ncbi:MAG: zinc ABC transporter substrate-binding protein [Burkholderiales bacterium]|jgi:zinc/manganese transport system substrate-binding protein
MKTVTVILCAILASALPSLSFAKLNAFACEPEWASLLEELGGNKVSIYQATSPKQDPHRVEARPSLVARMRRADLVVCSGSDLEIGWLPVLLRSAGNRKVQPGTPGYFMASEFVKRLDVPENVDRAMGDVHPYGNPHVHLDPRNISIIANALASRLAEIDGENADYYKEQNAAFQKKWSESIQRWEREAAGLKGLRLVTYHRDALYLTNWLGMDLTMTIEPKPGIPPSAGHLADLLSDLKAHPADVIVRMAYNEPKAPAWLSERTGIPEVELPFTVGGTKQAKDLYGLFDDTIERLNASTGR